MTDALPLDRDTLVAICRRFEVRRLAVFGSAVTGGFDTRHSDVDFVVEFERTNNGSLFDAYFGLKAALESVLGRAVDLVMASAIENPFFLASLRRTEHELYAA